MKDIFKNPILYYVAVPVMVGVWPLLIWAIYLPAARANVDEQMAQYKIAKSIMMEILTLDPDRLEFADSNDAATEFTYGSAVDKVANLCDIPPGKCDVHSGIIIETREQKSQSANVDLKQVDIASFAKFLSMIQFRWPSLQCESVTLGKKQNVPDNNLWDADIKFKYYY